MAHHNVPVNDWMTQLQLEEEFEFKVANQSRMRAAGVLPYSKIGKAIRYNREKINKLLNDAEVCHEQ